MTITQLSRMLIEGKKTKIKCETCDKELHPYEAITLEKVQCVQCYRDDTASLTGKIVVTGLIIAALVGAALMSGGSTSAGATVAVPIRISGTL